MIKSHRYRAGLWILRRLPGNRLFHNLAYSPNIGKGFRLGRKSCIIGEDVHIGEGVTVGSSTIILGKEISLGNKVAIGNNVEINCKKVRIGDRTALDDRCTIGGLPTPRSELKIGNDVRVFEDCYLNTTHKLTIGDGTGIGGRTMIWTHGSWQSILDGYPVTFAPTTLEENVWLPWHIVVMPGVTIGSGATIGAGAVVTRDIPPNVLAAGVPARILKDSSSYPKRIKMDERVEIISTILDDFGESLNGTYSVKSMIRKRKTFNTKREDNTWTVITPGEEWKIIVVAEPAEFDGLESDGRSLVLSLCPVGDVIWRRAGDFFGFLDLSERRYRIIGESYVVNTLLQVLGRYGVHMYPYGQ